MPLSSRFLLILLLAVLLRIAAAFYLGDTLDPVAQARIQDQVSYNALARSLLAGRGYSFEQDWYPFTPADTPTAHWSFLYPLFLAGVYAVTGYHPLAARLVQAVIAGILSTWLVYRLGKRLFGEGTGLAAAALSAVYAYFVYHDAALMTEPFFIAGVLASLILGLDISESEDGKYGRRRWAALGAVLGVTALLRQTILLWAPFLYLWLLLARRPAFKSTLAGIGLSIGIAALLILPWTLRNAAVYGAFLPLNSNAGYALYSANHPHHGTHFDQDYAAPLPAGLAGRDLNEAQWNTALAQRGLAFVVEDPGRYLLLSLDRVGVFFNFWFSDESGPASNWMRVLSFGLYLPFFIAGLALSWPQRKRCSLIYLFTAVFSALHILTWASIRYRLPVDAALMPFAALALVRLFVRVRSGFNLSS